MALPPPIPNQNPVTKTVQSVVPAEFRLVTYIDQLGQQVNQFCAVIGEDRVLLFDNREFAGGTERTPAGFATGWLREQILTAVKAGKIASKVMEGK
jgi:hypothetical protein